MNDKVQNDKQGSNVEIIRHRTDTYRYLVIDRIASVVYRLLRKYVGGLSLIFIELWKKYLTLMKFGIRK